MSQPLSFDDSPQGLALEQEFLSLRGLNAVLRCVLENWPSGAHTIRLSAVGNRIMDQGLEVCVEGYAASTVMTTERDKPKIASIDHPAAPWKAFSKTLVGTLVNDLRKVFGSTSNPRPLTRAELSDQVAVPLAHRASPVLRAMLEAQALDASLPSASSRPRGRV